MATTPTIHPTCAEIDLGAIRHNVACICEKVHPAEVMAVVKADAYGHGAVPVARAALQAGASRLAVAHVNEGITLRQAGIESPVQVMGGFFVEQIEAFLQAELEFTLIEAQQIDRLEQAALEHQKRVPVHVKFDTGMRRVGFGWETAQPVFQRFAASTAFELVGLVTHLATADERDKTFAREQLRRFRHIIEQAKRAGLAFRYTHAANSAAILDLPEACFDLVRAGISMYGYYPSGETSESIALKPALVWRSRLVQVKHLAAGEPVSYGATWCASQATTIGTVAVGYADGYRRVLSGRMCAVVNGRRVPVVGRVCMDMIMLDLGPQAPDRAGDAVILLGSEAGAEVSMREFCDALDTIPYEITCMISGRVPRQYCGE